MAGRHAAPGQEQMPTVRVRFRRPPRQPRTGGGLLTGLACLILAALVVPDDPNAAPTWQVLLTMGLALVTVVCWWPPRDP